MILLTDQNSRNILINEKGVDVISHRAIDKECGQKDAACITMFNGKEIKVRETVDEIADILEAKERKQ